MVKVAVIENESIPFDQSELTNKQCCVKQNGVLFGQQYHSLIDVSDWGCIIR